MSPRRRAVTIRTRRPSERTAAHLHRVAPKGVHTNRLKAAVYGRQILELLEVLEKEGFKTYGAMVLELARRGIKGQRGGPLTRERLYEIRQRFKN